MPELVRILIMIGLCACAESADQPVDPGAARRAFQPKLDARPDQMSLSSNAACYCYPQGPKCRGDAFTFVPPDAPDDVPACVEGEVCYGNPVYYADGFDGPRGRCRRTCFHAYARPGAEAESSSLAPFLKMDCADGEVCALWDLVLFEDIVFASVGECIPERH